MTLFSFTKKKGTKGKPRGPGTLTAQAKRHGMSVKQFIRHVNNNPKNFRKITKQRVNLAKTLMKL